MDQDFLAAARRCRLFEGLSPEETIQILQSLGAVRDSRDAGAYYLVQDGRTQDIFVVLSGRAAGERVTRDGAVSVINEFSAGDVFGDVLSGSGAPSLVSVRALTACSVLRIPVARLLSPESGFEEIRAALLRNLIFMISNKYFALSARVNILLCPTLRGKISLYLLGLMHSQGCDVVRTGWSREETASWLGCERSALSRELSRMRAQGMIDFRKDVFHILDRPRLEEAGG